MRAHLYCRRDGGAGHGVTRLTREGELRDGDGHAEVRRRFCIVAERGPAAGPAGLIDRPSLPVVGGVVAQSRQGRRGDPAIRDGRPRAARAVLERRADRLGLDIEPQLIAGIGIRHGRLEDHRPARGRSTHCDRRVAVALELPQTSRRIGRDGNRGAEVGCRFRVPPEGRPGTRPAGLIERARLPVICRVVREPGRRDERGLAVRHSCARSRGRAGEGRPHGLELHLQPQRISGVRIGHDAAQHDRRLIGRTAGGDGRYGVTAQLRQRLGGVRRARARDAQRERAGLCCAGRRRLDAIRPADGQQLVAKAGVVPAGAAVVGRERCDGIVRRAVKDHVSIERRRRHHDGETLGAMGCRAVGGGERVLQGSGVRHHRRGLARMHHEFDGHAPRAVGGVFGVHDYGVAIHAHGQPGGVECDPQGRGRRAAVRTHECEPRIATDEVRHPGERPRSTVRH